MRSLPLRRLRPLPLLLLAALAAPLAGCGSASAPAGMPMGAVELGYLRLAAEDITLTRELTGRVSALRSAEVRPQVDGVIKARLFKEGAVVKAGEALYQIDPAPFEAALASARAQLTASEAAAQLARQRAERYRRIVDSGAVSRDTNEEIQSAAQQADAAVGVARAAVDSARINLAYTEVRAPIAGRIGRSLVTPGALVSARQDAPIATIQDYAEVYVDLTEPASDLLAQRTAQRRGNLSHSDTAAVTLLLDDGTPYPQTGTLQFTEVTVDPGTAAVTVRALFPNADGILLPGSYARARIRLGIAPQALHVPQVAVGRDPTGAATVTLVSDDGKVEVRKVTLGAAYGSDWIVTDGLHAGDQVVVEGLSKLRPGLPVKAVPAGH